MVDLDRQVLSELDAAASVSSAAMMDESEPEPLPENAVKALPLKPELLPGPLRGWLLDIADRMQCPLDFPSAAAIVAAAALIGNKVAIRPKREDDWLVIANLWGAIVGSPGSLKSPAASEAMRPLFEIAKAERTAYEFERAEFGASKEAADVEKLKTKREYGGGKIGRDEFLERLAEHEIAGPSEKRIYTSDATIEKLGELLNENPAGMLILRDELTGWLRGLDKMGREQDKAFYLESWNGDGNFPFDRITRGTIHVKNLTLSIFGSIQPAMIGPYLRNAAEHDGADGLIQRFQLLVYPEPVKGYSYIDRRAHHSVEVLNLYRCLREMRPESIGARMLGERAFVSFDRPAQEYFQNWFIDLETTLRGEDIEDPVILSHLAKYRSLMPSLALIFHLVDVASGASAGGGVSLESAERAAAWCSYLKSHAEKLYSLRGTVFDTARLILKKIKSGHLDEIFTAKDVYRPCWSGLSDVKDVHEGLAVLADHGYVSPIQIETGGKPQTRFIVHKSLVNGVSG